MSSHAASEALQRADHAQHPRVTYRFHLGDAPSAGWKVVRVRIDERISATYEARVSLVGEPADDPVSLLGVRCTLEVRRGGRVRPLHGIVSRVDRRAGSSGSAVEVTVVPALAALGLGSDCRIFTAMSVPAVVEAVLGPALAPYGRSLEKRLRRDYPVREYVAQYRESDLAFVARLLAEEGIWFHFEHPEGRAGEVAELLCLVDDNDEARAAALGPEGPCLPLERAHAGLAHHEAVTDFVASVALASGPVHVRAFNWTHPRVFAEAAAPPAASVASRPVYLPDEVAFTALEDGRYTGSDAAVRAQQSWERSSGGAEGARGRGNLIGLVPGQQIEVRDPAHGGAAERWIVTEVRAEGRDADNSERAVQHLEDFACTFTCARAARPLRPALLPKPRVLGVQTGLVVGPDGKFDVEPGQDDIHVDPHGRVQVKLSWDRSAPGEPGATTTCFLRVAQAWAGRGFGVSLTPRVGMEVVVSFLEGDPDRPLVTGCVYNGLNEPPFALPSQKSQSGIRTRSTPGGEQGSALCFDDAAGRERVTLHAQRDHVVEVGRAQAVDVRAQRTLKVGGDDVTWVAGDRTAEVKGGENFACADSRIAVVGGDDALQVKGAQSIEITKAAEVKYDGGRSVQVAQSDRLAVTQGGNKDVHVEGRYHMQADRELKLSQDGAQVAMSNSELKARALGALQLENLGFKLIAKCDGSVTLKAQRSLTLEVGEARITLSSDGKVEVRGVECKIEGPTSALTLTASEAKLSAPIINIKGETLAEITAALVKLN